MYGKDNAKQIGEQCIKTIYSFRTWYAQINMFNQNFTTYTIVPAVTFLTMEKQDLFMKIFCRYWHYYLLWTIYMLGSLLKKVKSTNLSLKILWWWWTFLQLINWVDCCWCCICRHMIQMWNLLPLATCKVRSFLKIQTNKLNKLSYLFQKHKNEHSSSHVYFDISPF